MQLAKSRLSDGGVFVQWMNTNFVDEQLLKSLIATLGDVFGHIRLYRPVPETLVFLGSDKPLNLETYVAKDSRRFNSTFYRRLGLASVEDLLVAFAADDEGLRTLAAGAPINTDDNNVLATRGARLDHTVTESIDEMLASVDPLMISDSWVYRFFNPDLFYVAQRLNKIGFSGRARRLGDTLPVGPERWLVAATNLGAEGKPDQALRALKTAYSQAPDNPQLVYALLLAHLNQIAAGKVSVEAQSLVDNLRGECVNVLRALRYATQKDWPAVVQLDTFLGRVRPTQFCYPLAVQIRADWRTQVDPSKQPKLAKEAIVLVDSVLASFETLELYAVRAAAARAAGDNAAFIESALVIANGYQSNIRQAKQQDNTAMTDVVRQRLVLMLEELEKIEFGSGYSARLRLARRVYRGLLNSVE